MVAAPRRSRPTRLLSSGLTETTTSAVPSPESPTVAPASVYSASAKSALSPAPDSTVTS